MTTLLEIADRLARRNADANGVALTDLPGVSIVRMTESSGLIHAVSRPLACLVLQGGKRVSMGDRDLSFGGGDSLLITADVPTVSQVTRATAERPYLSLVLELDPGLVTELAVLVGPASIGDPPPVQVDATDADVADAALRLVRLVDRPAAIPALGAQLVRELHYWLLVGRHGTAIRRLGWPDGHARRIARAVDVLRSEYAATVPVERLATVAGMSVSSFHQHFRAQTSLSPLRFQKRLRLIEARRSMIAEGTTAGAAAFAVGYESVSQFTREYARMFGLPPAKETAIARCSAKAAHNPAITSAFREMTLVH